MIIDEILGAGDEYFAGKSVERMKQLTTEDGVTVLFVSHDLASVQALCDRVIWIDGGKIIMDSDPLSVVKEYRAHVNQRKERRLLARDAKVPGEYVDSLLDDSAPYTHILFRFVPEQGQEFTGQAIHHLSLTSECETVAEIDVGTARDNDSTGENYVIDSHGETNWGQPECRDGSWCRTLSSSPTRYEHAPFEFSIPRTHRCENLSLTVRSELEGQGLRLERFNGQEYQLVGVLSETVQQITFDLGKGTAELEDEAGAKPKKMDAPDNGRNPESTKYEYGSREAAIESVELFSGGLPRRVFTVFEPFEVEIHYSGSEGVPNPVFAFCAYTADGKCAFQWLLDPSSLGLDLDPLTGTIRFAVPELRLGKGAYVASVAAFKSAPNGIVEPEALHCLDRAVHFQVVEPVDQRYDLGLCVQTPQISVVGRG